MLKKHQIFSRYWSLAAALLLPIIEFSSEGLIRLFMNYEVARAVLSVVCIALLVHSWFMHRRYAENKWRLAFFTLLLSLIVLGPLWLGLNVLRAHYYPLYWDDQEIAVWSNICKLQDRTELFAKVLGIAVALWALVDLARWLAKRIRTRR
jgi:hypothetical protein